MGSVGRVWGGGARKNKTPQRLGCGVLRDKSLTMTYFHRRPSTIIGAKAFHSPVRDGKAWDHLAMVVKRNLSPARFLKRTSQFGKKQWLSCLQRVLRITQA